jgi:DNA-binding transcriptional MerR regulator
VAPYHIVLYRRESQQLTLERLAASADMHPDLVERFVEFGLVEPIDRVGETVLFDPSAIDRLRLIVRLRKSLGINIAGIAVVLDLLDKFCDLQRENERLRSRR